MKASSTLIAFFGILSVLGGLIIIQVSNYGLPPLPTGWVLAMILLILGGGGLISSIMLITHAKVSMKGYYYLNLILACLLIGLGVQTMLRNPLETPRCPCPAGTWGKGCNACECVNGVCNDGAEGDGSCLCDLGWGGELCDICAPTYENFPLCNRCKRGFRYPLEGCKECYPGYMDGPNGACSQCAPTWLVESDDLGLLCRRCKPSYYGGYCKFANTTQCREDGDKLAVAKDNDWWRATIYTGTTCTPTGAACENPYDCEGTGSFNCKGQCVKDDLTNGQVCEDTLECETGFECQYKVCCLEKKVGDGTCECGKAGYVYDGHRCKKCPGYDGVYSASICSGHGTCAAMYSGDPTSAEIVGLGCVCAPTGTEPFPSWSGESCGCLVNSDNGTCVECWSGYYGSDCQPCMGGSGISQCNMHGTCNDGLDGDGSCECHVDVKYRGLGGWKGESCDACINEDFWGDQCRICPNLQVVVCNNNTNPFIENQCTTSCAANTCNVTTGFCE